MPDILSPTGIEKPQGAEKHSRAMINRNYDRTNKIEADRRAGANIPFGHAGKVNGFQSVTGTNVAVVIDDQILRGGMDFESANSGRLIIPRAGLYQVTARIYATNGSGYKINGAAYKNSVALKGSETLGWKNDGTDFTEQHTVTVPLVAGDKIGLGMTSGVSTWGTDGYDGAYLEVLFLME